MHVRHPGFTLAAPVHAVLQPHIRAPCHQRRQVVRVMRRTRAASEHHDRIVQNAPIAVLIGVQITQEMRNALAQEQVVLRELQLTLFIRRMRQVMVRFR